MLRLRKCSRVESGRQWRPARARERADHTRRDEGYDDAAAFGIALLASQLGCLLLDREVRRVLDYRFRRAVPWLMAFLPPVFVPLVGLPAGLLLWLPAALVATAPLPRATLAAYARTARGAMLRA